MKKNIPSKNFRNLKNYKIKVWDERKLEWEKGTRRMEINEINRMKLDKKDYKQNEDLNLFKVLQ